MQAIKETGDAICSAIPARSGGTWEALSAVAPVLTAQIDGNGTDHPSQHSDGNAAATMTVNTVCTGLRGWRRQRRTIKRLDRIASGRDHDSQVKVITVGDDAGFAYQ